MNSGARILIAGIGNVFLGDDGFGVEVVQCLRRDPPPGAKIVDFGIRGMHLAYALAEPYDLVILVDAVTRGGRPGTLYLIEPERGDGRAPSASDISSGRLFDPHDMTPASVIRLASLVGPEVRRLLVVGCELGAAVAWPEPDDAFGAALSEPVRRAVGEAADMVRRLVAEEQRRRPSAAEHRVDRAWQGRRMPPGHSFARRPAQEMHHGTYDIR